MKTNQKPYNIYVATYNELLQSYNDARNSLECCTVRVALKRDVLSLYPAGPDRNAAEIDFAEEQRKLRNCIGAVDGRLADMTRYYKNNYSKLETENLHSPETYPTSHAIIELAYRNHYLR